MYLMKLICVNSINRLGVGWGFAVFYLQTIYDVSIDALLQKVWEGGRGADCAGGSAEQTVTRGAC